MNLQRKMQRQQLKRAVATVPNTVIKNIEELQSLNADLHAFNKELLKVYNASKKLLDKPINDLESRIELGKTLDRAYIAYGRYLQ